MRKITHIALSIIILMNVFTEVASAQQDQSSLLTVEPAQLNLELTADSKDASSMVVITNQYSYPVRMQAKFQGIDEVSGRIIPYGDLEGSLENVLRVSATEFEVAPESRYFLTVSVSGAENLQSGGHYATLVLEDISETAQDGTVRSQVSIGTFIVKKQGEIRRIAVVDKKIDRSFLSFPSAVSFELLNDGNVHVVPRGYIRIFDENFVYYESIINANSVTVLPNRRFLDERALMVRDSGWLPRKIKFEIGYRADGIETAELLVDEFWYVPKYFIPIPIALLAFIGITYLSRRQHRRVIMSHESTKA